MASSERAGRILAAAADLFARYGVAKTTVDDIASAAGISKGSVYLEFSGKQELFEAMVTHVYRAYLAAVSDRVARDPEGGRLARLYRHAVAELLSRPMLKALYTRDAAVFGTTLTRKGATRYAPRLLLGRDFVTAMQDAGLIRADLDPDVLSHAIRRPVSCVPPCCRGASPPDVPAGLRASRERRPKTAVAPGFQPSTLPGWSVS